MVPLAPKLKVITYHFISYRRKSVLNLVEIQNTKVPSKVTFMLLISLMRGWDFDWILAPTKQKDNTNEPKPCG